MATPNVARRSASSELSSLLDSPEIQALIRELEATRWTGRPGYPIRAMIGMALIKSLYAIPTWSRTAALVADHPALQATLGCRPSVYACYRFAAKLREHSDALARCLDRVSAALRAKLPTYGQDIAIDASDLPAYANGQRFVSKNGPERERFSDPDASWGHRSGFKVHAAVCAKTDLPVAWEVHTAREHESTSVASLLDAARARGFAAYTAVMDKGYDVERVYAECVERDCQPIIPLRQTTAVARGDHRPPSCEHGEWRFAGSDYQRGAAKWRCPTGECKPASTWVKADRLHPLIPRETLRWKGLYRKRASVEREFGRLKHD